MATAPNVSAVKETVQQLGKGVGKAKASVSDAIEDGKMAVERYLKRGRFAAEDAVSEGVHRIRHNPVSSVALAFTAGVLSGFLVFCIRRCRKN